MSYKPLYIDINSKKKTNTARPNHGIGIFIMVSLLITACIILFLKYDKISFYIKKDKYQVFETACVQIVKNKNIDSNYVKKLITQISSLISTYPNDPILYYYQGKFNSFLFNQYIRENPDTLINIYFDQFISKYNFYSYFKKDIWEASIVSFRKALALQLPKQFYTETYQNLSYLYLLGGAPYFNEASLFTNLLDKKVSIYKELLYITSGKETPNWEILQKIFNEKQIDFLKTIYYLKVGNTPAAFSILNTLITIDQDNLTIEEKTLVNNSIYLLGYINEINGNMRKKAEHLSHIDAKFFIKRHKWFFEEYTYLLRFLGDLRVADKFIMENESIYLSSF